METWRPCVDFPGYEVSHLGNVRSLNRIIVNRMRFGPVRRRMPGRALRKKITTHGYEVVTICGKQRYVHRLVAKAFIPVVPGKKIINHKNSVRSDNWMENLEWCTPGENIVHAHTTGRTRLVGNGRGGGSKLKLTKEDIRAIRFFYVRGATTNKILAKTFGVKKSTICNIAKRNTYRWVDELDAITEV